MKTAEEILDRARLYLNPKGLGNKAPADKTVYHIALECMEEYADQFKPKWIPVTERLPEEKQNGYSDYVLGYSDTFRGVYFVIRYDYDSEQFLHEKGHDAQYNPITHWTPLLEQPTTKD